MLVDAHLALTLALGSGSGSGALERQWLLATSISLPGWGRTGGQFALAFLHGHTLRGFFHAVDLRLRLSLCPALAADAGGEGVVGGFAGDVVEAGSLLLQLFIATVVVGDAMTSLLHRRP